MNVLVNANCSKGGSIPWCAAMTVLLGEYPRHRFVVCVSPQVRQALGQGFVPASNVEVLDYPRRSKLSMLLRRAPALDALVDSRGIDMVLTVFGPAYWRPRVPHLCGFAKSQYIYRHSPFFRQMSRRERLVLELKRMVHMAAFRRDPDAYITEREPISEALRQLIPGKPVYTVSNSCNPVFARQEEWMSLPLPPFDGVTLLTVSADYPHKNLGMIPRVAEYLRRSHPEFKFRFVVTLGPEVFGYGAGNVPEWLLPVGKVDIRECPSLYEQCDIMFLPTLLECFSASYAEAMKMKRPILTSDLSFARGLCGVAAEYFDPLSPELAGEAVYRLANAPRRRRELVEAGEKRGREFLSAEARTLRYIHYIGKRIRPALEKRPDCVICYKNPIGNLKEFSLMKQIIQDLKNGGTILEEVPVPQVRRGALLIRTRRTLVSLGTERMLVEFGKAGLLDKARQQPDRVKQVLDKMRTDGIRPTLEAVFNKLSQPLPLGYCNVGTVIEVGAGVTGFQVGDRVASNGPHAEFVCVPRHLCAKIPDNVGDDAAAFTVIGSIALQGVRNFAPQLGEVVAVVGLGLVGLVTAQLLQANGCRVIGSDFDPAKVALARSFGVEAVDPRVDGDLETAVAAATAGVGADGVIITASAKSDEIIHQACQMCRKRGRIVLVGVIGMNMRRDDFYKKELSFQVSCSYGAGRYDEEYEQKGHDYPLPYVRWTEQRNFETVLRALSTGALRVEPLITESVELKDYLEIYGDMRKAGSIASLIRFPEAAPLERRIAVAPADLRQGAAGRIALIGAGNFASSTIVPCLKKAHAAIRGISSAQGLSAKILAKKAGAELATSDTEALLNDPQVSTVIVCARHNLHAPLVKRALAAGKSVFVEKPLCLNREELAGIEEAYRAAGPGVTLTVGFNRRFSPFAEKLKRLSGAGPKHIVATMNAGFIAPEVWVQDMEIGGGRIVGEACHFIDLCSYLADSHVVAVCMNALGEHPDVGTDNASILLRYANGSNAVVNYFSNGSKAYAKERVEVFSQGSVLVLDNWRKLTGYGVRGFSSFSAGLDKGHRAQFALLAERAARGGEALIPFASIKNTTLASFACLESLKQGKWIEVEA